MEFTSIIFAIFYSIIFVLYWQVSEKSRNVILLLANIVFYLSFGIKYAFTLVYIIVFSFFVAKVLEQKRKKVILMLAVLGTVVFLVIFKYTGFAIVLANLGFTIQLYCDFSGYSDMAIGFAKMLNIHLKENFTAPYFSASIKEFWSRWHISLSGWLRDYIYIPLGGSRCSKIRGMFNLMLTFLISGIWHGAGIKYLIWGGMHGILQCAEKICIDIFNVPKTKRKISNLFSIIVTFLIINFTWLPFWLPTTKSFLYALTHMFEGMHNMGSYIRNGINEFNIDSFMVVTLLVSLSVLIVHDYKAKKSGVYDRFVVSSKLEGRIVRIFLLILVLCFNCVSGSGFIYFQF